VTAASPSVPPSPAAIFADLVEGLCKSIAAHGARGLLTMPLLLLLWSRLRRMAVRARRLAARTATGAPPPHPRPPTPRSAPSRPYIRLPRGVAWLVRAVPGTAWGAARLQFLLDDPAMAAAAASPPMRRLLRPLCRMLGVRPPPIANQPAPRAEAAAPEPVPRPGEPPRNPPAPPQSAPPAPASPAIPPCAA
jgi:hypothetical protein